MIALGIAILFHSFLWKRFGIQRDVILSRARSR
jgi:hypothetical protein